MAEKPLHPLFVSILFGALAMASPQPISAQAATLIGLIGDATDVNFYFQRVGTKGGANMRPIDKSGASGLGFEFSYSISSKFVTRKQKTIPDSLRTDARTCLGKYARYRQKARASATPFPECADTTWTLVERTSSGGVVTIKETPKTIVKFDSTAGTPVTQASLELALGFSQAGPFRPRTGDSVVVSIRELPSASVYATFEPNWRVSPYLGFRTGLASLQGGRYYHGAVTKFGGDTFQLGIVAGIAYEIAGLNLFAEAAYTRRAFDSVEWDGDPPSSLRSMSFSGPSLAFGSQIHFREHPGK